MNLLITGSCGHIGSYIAENVKNKKSKNNIDWQYKIEQICSLFNLKKNLI